MNAAQRLIEQGIEQGIERGIEKGQRGLLLKLIRLKFGELPSNVLTRIEQGRGDELDAWSAHILTAQTLEEIFD